MRLMGWLNLAQQLKVSKIGRQATLRYSLYHTQFCPVAKTKSKWFLTYCFNHQTFIC